jgi:hypothetical protein
VKNARRPLTSRKPLRQDVVRRILRRVPYQEGFRFSRGLGDYTGQVATSLEDFVDMLRTVDLKSVEFHMERQDFEKWVRIVFGDEELAQIIHLRSIFSGENLRKKLLDAITNHLDELKKMPTMAPS